MVVISHPTGNTFTRAVLSGLERADANYEFHTSLAVPRDSRWLRHLPGRWQEELGRRTYDIHLSRLHIHPGRELVRLASSALGWRGLSRHEEGFASIDAVCRSLDRAVARRVERGGGVRCVYAFEDAARDTFHAARDRGIRTAYNLPIAYWETSRRLLQEEAARLPEWEPTLGATRDSAEKCGRKTEELTQADIVVCPSEFVARSLPRELRETKQCIVAPFGSPPAVEHAPLPDGGKLRVLFAGSMSQRKGLADVLAAFKLLRRSDVELVVMGTPLIRTADAARPLRSVRAAARSLHHGSRRAARRGAIGDARHDAHHQRVLRLGLQLVRGAAARRRVAPDRLRQRLPRLPGHFAPLPLPVAGEGEPQVVDLLRRDQAAHAPEPRLAAVLGRRRARPAVPRAPARHRRRRREALRHRAVRRVLCQAPRASRRGGVGVLRHRCGTRGGTREGRGAVPRARSRGVHGAVLVANPALARRGGCRGDPRRRSRATSAAAPVATSCNSNGAPAAKAAKAATTATPSARRTKK